MTGAVTARPMPVGMWSPSRQLVAAEGEIEPDERAEHAEDHHQRRGLHAAGHQHADHGADGDARAPAAQDAAVDGALLRMRAHRALRGEDDGGERGGEADLHDLRPVVAEREEGVEEGRHQHDAAADAEQPGDHAGDGADQDQERHQRQELGEIGQGHGRGLRRRDPLP